MDQPSGWWMFHGDPAHTGNAPGSSIDAALVKSGRFGLLHSLTIGGPVLSTPAVCNGFVYVGLANTLEKTTMCPTESAARFTRSSSPPALSSAPSNGRSTSTSATPTAFAAWARPRR